MNFLKNNHHQIFQSWFKEIALKLFREYELVVNNAVYGFSEIEFYYHSNNHEDPYVHKDNMQLTNGQWYFHGSGIDITFGEKSETFGGILIRGIKRIKPSSQFYSGPLVVAKEIFQQLGDVEFGNHKIGLRKKKESRDINNDFAQSTRINLPKNKENDFRNEFYRFITYIQSEHHFKEKTVVAKNLKSANPQIDIIEKFGYKII